MPGRISRRTVEAVRERADLVELVEARTGPVRRSGPNVMARCPFHEERTPSCSIDPVAKLYHCFGCGEGGDVFTLVQKLESLPFDEAVASLAERYGIEIEYEDLSPAEQRRMDDERRLESLLADARRYYARVLAQSPAAAPAREYVRERGIEPAMVERFGLGFSPPEWDRLSRLALGKGYRADDLIAAGLATRGQRGLVDRFRGRLMFPLTDARGRVRGFGARVMPGQEGPKYLNSPESPIFHKSRLLYGLHEARPAIGRSGRALVVEGYTDVIALHQAGYENVVAAMGTSLTEEQLRELRRLCSELVLAFDADAAGQDAALRGLRLAEQRGFDVRVVPLPPGRDPAELAAEGREAVDAAIAGARRVLEFEIDLLLQRRDTASPDELLAQAREVLGPRPETTLRLEQLKRVADALRVDPRLLRNLGARRVQPEVVQRTEDKAATVERRRELEFLGLCLAVPEAGKAALEAAEAGGHLASPAARALLPWVRERLSGAAPEPPPGLESEAAAVVAAGARFEEPERDLADYAARLELLHSQREVNELLKLIGPKDENTPETQRLVALRRRIADLEARLRSGAV